MLISTHSVHRAAALSNKTHLSHPLVQLERVIVSLEQLFCETLHVQINRHVYYFLISLVTIFNIWAN